MTKARKEPPRHSTECFFCLGMPFFSPPGLVGRSRMAETSHEPPPRGRRQPADPDHGPRGDASFRAPQLVLGAPASTLRDTEPLFGQGQRPSVDLSPLPALDDLLPDMA